MDQPGGRGMSPPQTRNRAAVTRRQETDEVIRGWLTVSTMEDLPARTFRQGRGSGRDRIKRKVPDYVDSEGFESHSKKFEKDFAMVTAVAQTNFGGKGRSGDGIPAGDAVRKVRQAIKISGKKTATRRQWCDEIYPTLRDSGRCKTS
jgi:hypothetical protein